jgi:hypothetical protein
MRALGHPAGVIVERMRQRRPIRTGMRGSVMAGKTGAVPERGALEENPQLLPDDPPRIRASPRVSPPAPGHALPA